VARVPGEVLRIRYIFNSYKSLFDVDKCHFSSKTGVQRSLYADRIATGPPGTPKAGLRAAPDLVFCYTTSTFSVPAA
jgi:hypothetical protein